MLKLKVLTNNLKVKAKNFKKDIAVLFLAYKKPGVPWYAKALAVITVGYALSPIDLIPDFIPILGYLDDLILIPLGIALSIKLIPPSILEECRKEADDVFKNGKPRNYIAAAVIIIAWAAIAALILYKISG